MTGRFVTHLKLPELTYYLWKRIELIGVIGLILDVIGKGKKVYIYSLGNYEEIRNFWMNLN